MIIDTNRLREEYSVGTPLDRACDIIVALCDDLDKMRDLLTLCEPHIDAGVVLDDSGEHLRDVVQKALLAPTSKREMESISRSR